MIKERAKQEILGGKLPVCPVLLAARLQGGCRFINVMCLLSRHLVFRFSLAYWCSRRGSPVGTEANYWLDDRGIGVREPGQSIGISSTTRLLGCVQSIIQRVPGKISSRVKRPESETDVSSPTTAKIKET
jgi:hypothetical protein